MSEFREKEEEFIKDRQENGRESIEKKLDYVEPVLKKLEVSQLPCSSGTSPGGACGSGVAPAT